MAISPHLHANSSPAVTQNAHLLRLPQEVFEEVVFYLTPDDLYHEYADPLLTLRATCKEVELRTQNIVANHYFDRRRCSVSDEKELAALLGISIHPAFSKAVKSTMFDFLQVRDLLNDSPYVSSDNVRKLRNRKKAAKRKYEGLRSENAVLRKELLQSCRQVVDSQNLLLRRGGDSGYLHMIFFNFKVAGNIPELKFGNNEDNLLIDRPMSAKGIDFDEQRDGRSTFEDLGYRYGVDWRGHRPFEVISEALRNTKYPITSLQAGCGDVGVPLWPDEFVFKGSICDALKDLRIYLEPARKGISDIRASGNRLRDSIRTFVAFLRQCTKLESIGLTASDSCEVSEDAISAAFTEEVASTEPEMHALRGVRNVWIGLRCYTDDMLRFVRAMRFTLKRLELACEPHDRDQWIPEVSIFAAEVLRAYDGPSLELVGFTWGSVGS